MPSEALGIAHSTGDLAIADLADGVDHSGDGVLELGIGQDREQRGERLRTVLVGTTETFLSVQAEAAASAAMRMFPLLGRMMTESR